MRGATAFFLIAVVGILLWANYCDPGETTLADDAPVNHSRIPYFLRYNAPVRDPSAYSVIPVAGVPLATALPAAPAGNGFAGFNTRLV